MSRLGYARVSTTDKQTTDSQTLALRENVCERIFEDKVTGARDPSSRQGWQMLLDYAREGDTIVVFSMSRVGRSLRGVVETLDDLDARGLTLVSLT